MSRSSRSKGADENINGLEALGFIAPAAATPAAPAVAPPSAAPFVAPVVAHFMTQTITPAVAATAAPSVAASFTPPVAPLAPPVIPANFALANPQQGSVSHPPQIPAATGVPLTRRQLREMEALQAGGQQAGLLQGDTAAPAASTSPTPWATLAEPAYQTTAPSYSERGRRGEGASPASDGTSARGARNYARTTPAPHAVTQRVVRVSARKRLASHLFTGVVMIFAAAFLVGTTVPANAFMPNSQELADAPAPVSVRADAQSMAVSNDVVGTATDRGSFTVTSYAQMLRAQYGTNTYNYAMTTGAIRWPFPYVVPISSGFGGRVAPCRGCSSMHMGLDFVPGAGTPIYSIADGVVAEHDISTWGLGNSVVISHTIGGQSVESVYAHMQTGTVVVEAGQEIKVGDLIGLVGSTGTSTGSHLHFEIHLDGVQVDPFAWLKANVTN